MDSLKSFRSQLLHDFDKECISLASRLSVLEARAARADELEQEIATLKAEVAQKRRADQQPKQDSGDRHGYGFEIKGYRGGIRDPVKARDPIQGLLEQSPQLVHFLNVQNSQYQRLKVAHRLLTRKLRDSQTAIKALEGILSRPSSDVACKRPISPWILTGKTAIEHAFPPEGETRSLGLFNDDMVHFLNSKSPRVKPGPKVPDHVTTKVRSHAMDPGRTEQAAAAEHCEQFSSPGRTMHVVDEECTSMHQSNAKPGKKTNPVELRVLEPSIVPKQDSKARLDTKRSVKRRRGDQDTLFTRFGSGNNCHSATTKSEAHLGARVETSNCSMNHQESLDLDLIAPPIRFPGRDLELGSQQVLEFSAFPTSRTTELGSLKLAPAATQKGEAPRRQPCPDTAHMNLIGSKDVFTGLGQFGKLSETSEDPFRTVHTHHETLGIGNSCKIEPRVQERCQGQKRRQARPNSRTSPESIETGCQCLAMDGSCASSQLLHDRLPIKGCNGPYMASTSHLLNDAQMMSYTDEAKPIASDNVHLQLPSVATKEVDEAQRPAKASLARGWPCQSGGGSHPIINLTAGKADQGSQSGSLATSNIPRARPSVAGTASEDGAKQANQTLSKPQASACYSSGSGLSIDDSLGLYHRRGTSKSSEQISGSRSGIGRYDVQNFSNGRPMMEDANGPKQISNQAEPPRHKRRLSQYEDEVEYPFRTGHRYVLGLISSGQAANRINRQRRCPERAPSPPGYWRTDMPSSQDKS